MITIYGSPQSSSGRCFWCLEEVGTPYETKSISFKDGEHKTEEYLKINPNGKVPTLVDGDFAIWESMAINFYLAETYKPDLLGSSVKDRSLVRQWSFWSLADLQTPIIDVFIQLVFVPEERRNAQLIEKSLGKLPALMSTLDKALEGKDYLVGNTFSLADLNVTSVAIICKEIKFEMTDYKNVGKWLQKISEQASYQRFMGLCK